MLYSYSMLTDSRTHSLAYAYNILGTSDIYASKRPRALGHLPRSNLHDH